MKRLLVPVALATFALPIFTGGVLAQESATGFWSGSHTGTSNCPSGSVITPISGTISWWIVQDGSSIRGSLSISGLVDHDESCNATIMPDELMSFVGTRSGSSFNAVVISETEEEGQDETMVSGTITDQTISFSNTDTDGSISASATKRDVVLGPATGQWNGTYGASEQCLSQTISYGGSFEVSIVQVGTKISGLAFLDHVAMVEPPTCVVEGYVQLYVPIVGTVSGRSVTGSIFDVPFTGTVAGALFSGSFGEDPLAGTFTTSLGSAPSQIGSFVASPVRIRSGGSSTLTWSTSNAMTVTVDHGLGSQPAKGSIEVSPASTTTYTLTTTGADGSSESASVDIEVVTVPDVVVTSRPKGMIAVAGSGSASDSYVLFNRGGSSTNISLAKTGSFFTQSPASFSLPAGSSRTITITGLARPAGSYEGSSIPSGSGVPSGLSVPIHMVATSSTGGGGVASVASRVDVSGPLESNPSGSIEFRNSGTAAVTGVLTSDAPWIIPDSGAITIPAGGTGSASFSIDRAARTSYDSPGGSASGTLRLTVLEGGTPAKNAAYDHTLHPSNGVAVTSTLVTIVDTATPQSSSSGIPPLAPGETALFVPGVVSSDSTLDLTDIAIMNQSGGASLGDVDLFFTNAVGATQKASATTIQPSQSLAYANAVNTVFGASGAIGTLQLRSMNVDEIVLSATRTSDDSRSTMPVFRSDEGVEPGGSIPLTGIQNDSMVETTLFIQEVSGGSTTISVDYYESGGSVVGSSGSMGIAPWTFTMIDDEIPSAAVSAILTNQDDDGNTGAIVAYASVLDRVSKDRWIVVESEPASGTSDESLLPYLADSVARRRPVFRPESTRSSPRGTWTSASIFNPASVATNATFTFRGIGGSEAATMLTLAEHETVRYENILGELFGTSGTGIATIGTNSGNPTTAVRVHTAGSSGGKFGMAIPQLSTIPALTLGESKVFSNLSDLTASTIESGAAGKKRSAFGIVETAGATMTVRVTMAFSDPRWLMAAVQNRDYHLDANEILLVESVGASILGASRDDLLGDLEDIQLRFQVVDGEGAATIFVIETDNASGDTAFRAQ